MKSFEELLKKKNTGSLKVYLGYAAGVGKTYAMLREGHTLRTRGFDVVIGYVEPHARPDTSALINGLEMIAPQQFEWGEKKIPEMDLDAILARKPQIVLVDELAHSNVTGSKNSKRFEDVLEILKHDINVITTLNVQHLESVADRVSTATQVAVQERLPDAVLQKADQVVIVDVAMEELRERLRLGKIYSPERAETALQHFFSYRNLAFLRELCLREGAGAQNRKTEAMGFLTDASPTNAEEPVMVAMSSDPTDAANLIRKGARLAAQFSSRLFVVYVRKKAEAPTRIEAGLQRRLQQNLVLAKSLGAEVVTLHGENISDVLVNFAQDNKIRHAIFGKSRMTPLNERFRGSILLEFIHDAVGIDVHILTTETGRSL